MLNWTVPSKKQLALLLATLLLIFVGLETVSRLYYGLQHRTIEDAYFGTVYRSYEFVGWTFLPNSGGRWQAIDEMAINEYGFRGPSFSLEKPPDTYRIITFGGSTSHAGNYPAKLQGLLDQQPWFEDKRAEVINAATPAWTTTHSLVQYVTRASYLEPDLIIIYHAINDIGMTKYQWLTDLPQIDYDHYNVWRRSSLFFNLLEGLLTNALSNYRAARWAANVKRGTLEPQSAETFDPQTFATNLTHLAVLAEHHGTTVVFVTQATVHSPDRTQEENALNAGYAYRTRYPSSVLRVNQLNEVTRQIARQRNHLLVDAAASDIAGEPEYFDDLCHLNDKGAERLAQVVYEGIKQQLARVSLNRTSGPI